MNHYDNPKARTDLVDFVVAATPHIGPDSAFAGFVEAAMFNTPTATTAQVPAPPADTHTMDTTPTTIRPTIRRTDLADILCDLADELEHDDRLPAAWTALRLRNLAGMVLDASVR